MTDTMHITPELKIAADAVELCAQFSIDNPAVSLRNNPHFKATQTTHRKATGSIKTLWVCACGKVMPRITANLTTVCCGRTEVDLHR